jgi:hypothetical protein
MVMTGPAMSAPGHSRRNWAALVMSGLPPGGDRGEDIPDHQSQSACLKGAIKRHLLPKSAPCTLHFEVAWGRAREKFAISVSVDAVPAVVKVA